MWTESFKTRREVMAFLRGLIRGEKEGEKSSVGESDVGSE